ncbi:MAG: fibronectin/fibrinogen-binding protein [Clostridia bacterium]|nr:fibronectin/fibrinogen-binding protein [Clostridia bacterium]
MAYDGMTMAAVTQELQCLVDARIDKIYQPEQLTVLLHLRQKDGARYRLLLSAEAMGARIHLTDYPYLNPASPPMFCMLLRKYLEGGRILSVIQQRLERILVFTVQSYNELRELCERRLICEVMGKHSNIILVNPDTGLIIDGIKRYSHAVSRHREVLPGSPYLAPPPQNKKDPRLLSYEELEQGLLEQLEKTVTKALVQLLEGVSPLLAGELAWRAGLPEEAPVDSLGAYEFERIYSSLQELVAELEAGCPTPSLVREETGFTAFSAFKLSRFVPKTVHPSSVNETIDLYYQKEKEQRLFTGTKHRLTQVIKKELERCYKKAALQEDTLCLASEAEEYRIKGEILTANLFRIRPGDREVTLENFYDPNGNTLTIPLLPELSPAENAQRYFRHYNKAKNAAQKAAMYHRETIEEIAYLEGIQHSLETADTRGELDEIEEELVKQGYLKKPATKEADKKSASKPEPLAYLSSDGFSLLVGKNNRQNDYLTLKVAKDRDLWLHTKDIAGSHVIIKNPEGKPIPERTLLEAAHLAAYFSKGRMSSKVPVDYTERKNVKKPAGARPGMVIYENYQTVYVTPDKELIEKLVRKQ